jgi:Arc/MetJ-type ribon-helix-helix transcriptional regulator
MVTINISLPEKLKDQANALIEGGFFVSFSDLVRHSLRETVSKNKYDLWADEAEKDIKNGKATIIKSKNELKKYFDSL